MDEACPFPLAADAALRRPSELFLSRWRPALEAADGLCSFAEYMDFALYDPVVGYYRRNQTRVGSPSTGADFQTASGIGAPVFGRLVAAAAASILEGSKLSPANHAFIELGAEPGEELLRSPGHGFAYAASIRLGQPWQWPERAVVFSNELFDAQPFHRLRFSQGAWREWGVALGTDGALCWRPLPRMSDALLPEAVQLLPPGAPEGYGIDLPWPAALLARDLAARPWTGLFLAFDYGLSWETLQSERPQGTGRGYYRHQVEADLLARPGEQDLTCHVCWDWISAALSAAGFTALACEAQESFFVRRSESLLQDLVRAGGGPLSPEISAIRQLLHPGYFGRKFQVLSAVRLRLPGSPAEKDRNRA